MSEHALTAPSTRKDWKTVLNTH